MVSCMPIAHLGLTREEDKSWVTRRVTRQPYATFVQPIRLAGEGGADLPRMYVYCTETASGTFQQFAARVSANPQWRFTELKAGHDVMIDDPKAVAEVLTSTALALQSRQD
jgi:hypothetical protein